MLLLTKSMMNSDFLCFYQMPLFCFRLPNKTPPKHLYWAHLLRLPFAWWFLRLPLFLMTLPALNNIGQVFFEFLNFALSDVFIKIRPGLWVWGRKPQKWSTVVIMLYKVWCFNMTCHCWCSFTSTAWLSGCICVLHRLNKCVKTRLA